MPSAANQDVSVLQGGQSRIFIQEGINPATPYLYYGNVMLGGPSKSLGEPEPVYLPSSSQRGKWDIVDTTPKNEELGTSEFTARADRFLRDIWWTLKRKGCNFNLQVVNGACQRPDQFNRFDAKLLLSSARLTEIALGELNPLSGEDNAPVDLTGSISFEDMMPINSISFEQVADATVVAEVLDGLYYDLVSCGDCGQASDGCQKSYWLTLANSGSPGLSSQIVYSLDGGSTWATLDIPTLGGLSGSKLAAVGSYLVVISQANNAHHYSPFSDVDAGTINFIRQNSGYVATKGPRAIYSKTPNLTFVGAAGGYIYKMSDPTLAVTVLTDGSISTQDLNAVHGYGRTIVAVGGSNAVLKSDNDGETFSLVTGPATGVNLTAVWVMSKDTWLVGTGGGKLYYTLNGGTSWTEKAFGASGASVVNDIKFFGNVIGYMAVEVGGAARVYRSTDSGYSWEYQAPHIASLPTSVRINVVVPCGVNSVAAGGRKTANGDGLIAVAS